MVVRQKPEVKEVKEGREVKDKQTKFGEWRM